MTCLQKGVLSFWQYDFRRQELGGVATVFVDVAHDARRHAYQLALGEQEDGLQLGMQALVGMTDHVLILEVAAATKATDDGVGAHLLAEVGGETCVALYLDLRVVGEDGLAPSDAVLQVKGGTLFHVDADGDIDLVEHGEGTQYDGTVTQSDGVEGTGEYGYSFHFVCFEIGCKSITLSRFDAIHFQEFHWWNGKCFSKKTQSLHCQ